jgi:hypothetical protein
VVANNLGKSHFLQVAHKGLFLYINFNAIPNALLYFSSTRCRARSEYARRCCCKFMPSLQYFNAWVQEWNVLLQNR